MSELEYFLSVENIEISRYAQARQSLLLLTQGNIYNCLRFLNKYLMFLEELNESPITGKSFIILRSVHVSAKFK